MVMRPPFWHHSSAVFAARMASCITNTIIASSRRCNQTGCNKTLHCLQHACPQMGDGTRLSWRTGLSHRSFDPHRIFHTFCIIYGSFCRRHGRKVRSSFPDCSGLNGSRAVVKAVTHSALDEY